MATDPIRVQLEEAANRADSAASAFYQVLINDRNTPVPVEGGEVDSMAKRIYDQVGASVDTLEQAAIDAEAALTAANYAVTTATDKAGEASASAAAALTSKTDAQAARDAAAASATAAAASAATAGNHAVASGAYANSAASSAATATLAKNEAQAAATAASQSEDNAAGSASAAAGSASTASTASGTATTAKNAAEAARDAAIAAKNDAQSAQSWSQANAIDAADSSASATASATSADIDANTAKDAKNQAVVALSGAQTSEQNASFSANAAAASAATALNAKNSAEASQNAAASSESSANLANNEAQAAAAAASQSEDNAAASASTAAGSAAVASAEASTATAAKNAAESARDSAIYAKNDAQDASGAAQSSSSSAATSAASALNESTSATSSKNAAAASAASANASAIAAEEAAASAIIDLNSKVDKVPGMGLSQNSFTDIEKSTIDASILSYSELPEAIAAAVALPDGQSVIVQSDSRHNWRSTRNIVMSGFVVYVGLESSAESTSFSQSGVGASSRTAQEKMRDFVSLQDFVKDGSGLGDDSQSLADACAALPRGGVIYGGNGERYRFPDGFSLPKGVKFIGTWTPREDVGVWAPASNSSCLLVGGSGTINVGNGATIEGWLIWRDGLEPATSAADAEIKVSGFTGTAVTVSGADAKVRRNTIIGFNIPVVSHGYERTIIEENHYDCNHGPEVSQSFDICRVEKNHGWPFFTVHQSWTSDKILQRVGRPMSIDNVADFIYVLENFAYGYRGGFLVKDLAAASVIGNKLDNVISEAAGTVGFETRGNMNNVVFDNNHCDSHDFNYRFAHTSGGLVGGVNTSGQAATTQYQFLQESSGVMGSLAAAGGCVTPFAFASGIGKWRIDSVLSRNTPSSGLVYLIENEDDLNNISIGWSSATGSGSDVICYGNSKIPAWRPTHDSTSGIWVNKIDGTFGISSNGRPSCIFPPAENAINFAVISNSSSGQAVDIRPEGGDENIGLTVSPKGAGHLNFGATPANGAVTNTSSVVMYFNGVPYKVMLSDA